jgi:3-methyladenine DNA glycosylase AlkD
MKETIIQAINDLADEKRKIWWDNYMKNSIKFIGVGIPQITKILQEKIDKKQDKYTLQKLADELISLEISEYKLAGILIYQKFLLNKLEDAEIIENISEIFDKNYIYDWSTCDWLCVRVLSPLIKKQNNEVVKRMQVWNENENVWKARASLVAFVSSNQIIHYLEIVKTLMEKLIQRKERFAKTAVGWILREISKTNMNYVEEFLKKYTKYLTSEIINNALKYKKKEDLKSFKEALK